MVDKGNRRLYGEASLSILENIANTCAILYAGLNGGRIRNASGGNLTVSFHEASSLDGEAFDVLSSAGVAQSEIVIPDQGSLLIPAACEGVEYLVLTTGLGTGTGTSEDSGISIVVWANK